MVHGLIERGPSYFSRIGQTSILRVHFRAELQRIFFPSIYQNATETQPRRTGQERIFPYLKIVLEARNGLLFEIPFREASKVIQLFYKTAMKLLCIQNWMWDEGRGNQTGRKRTGASLQLRTGAGSAVRYILPMVSDEMGYHASLDVYCSTPTLVTSANDMMFLRTSSLQV